MTNEDLDKARAKEAEGDAVKAARLAREGWMPPEPVDPDVLLVRGVSAKMAEDEGNTQLAKEYRAGSWDAYYVRFALAVLRAERERVAKLEPKPDADGWVWISPPAGGGAKIEVRHGAGGDIIAWRRA